MSLLVTTCQDGSGGEVLQTLGPPHGPRQTRLALTPSQPAQVGFLVPTGIIQIKSGGNREDKHLHWMLLLIATCKQVVA